MQLLRLRLVNFRQHADTELEFGPGITGIIGPNGSGKTSILEALAWALYGVQAVRGDKDSIRRLGAEGRAGGEGDLEFRLGAPGDRRSAKSADAARRAAEDALGREEPRWNEWMARRERTLSLDGERRMAEQAVVSSRQEFQRLDKELADALAAREQLRALGAELAPVARLKQEVAAVEGLRREAATRRTEEAQLAELARNIRMLERRLTEVGDVPESLTRADAAARELHERLEAVERVAEEERTVWVRDRQYAETKRTELLKQYEEVKEQRDQIVKLGPQGTCPTCKRPLGPEYAGVLALLDAQLEVITGDGKYFRQRLEQLAQPPTKLLDAEAEGFSDAEYRQAKDRYDRAVGALRESELAVVEARGELNRAEDDLAEAKRRVAERAQREREIAALKARQRLHNELDRAFSDLRGELNARMRPEIAELASGFLADLTDGRYDELELTEDYTLTILEGGVPKPVISGGEEDIASLVLRLAISQMIAERAGQPLSLLVLDEIFGSLDEARRLHVVGLLRRLADRFPQVILITHIEQVREGLDRVIRVDFDPARGASVVRDDTATLGAADAGVAA